MGVFGEIGNFGKFLARGAMDEGVTGIARGAARGVKLGGGELMENSFVKNLYRTSGANISRANPWSAAGNLSSAHMMGRKTIASGAAGIMFGATKLDNAFRK